MLFRKLMVLAISGLILLSSCAQDHTPNPYAPKNEPQASTAHESDTTNPAISTSDESQQPAREETVAEQAKPSAADQTSTAGEKTESDSVGQATRQKPEEAKSQVGEEPAKRIAVGDKAPAFRLKDQNGQEHALGDLVMESKVALVFFRSADW